MCHLPLCNDHSDECFLFIQKSAFAGVFFLFSPPQFWTNHRIQQISPEKQSNCNYHSFKSRYWCQRDVPRLSFSFLFSPLKMRLSFEKHKVRCFAHWSTDLNRMNVKSWRGVDTCFCWNRNHKRVSMFGFLMFKQTSKKFHQQSCMHIFFNWYDETQWSENSVCFIDGWYSSCFILSGEVKKCRSVGQYWSDAPCAVKETKAVGMSTFKIISCICIS